MSNSQTEWWVPVERGEGEAPDEGNSILPAESRRSRARGRERQQRERQRRRRRTAWVLVVALVLVAGAGYVVVSLVRGMLGGADQQTVGVQDYPGPGHGTVRVVVNPGDTGAAMATTLVENGVVATRQAFLSAYDANPDATSIQPGTYDLMQEMRASDAVAWLLDPANKASLKVTIPEGLTATQTLDKITEKTLIPTADLQTAIADPASIGLPAEAGGNVEGWLFPATYEVEPDATATQVLSQMTAKTVQVLTDTGVPQDQWETVLNKASLVEREARRDEDRPKVARAIENRLERNLALDIDSAVAYGLGIPGTALTTEMTKDASNPYNTYKHLGLPPTPIASPGEKSIDAVLSPADGTWIFWVTVNLDTGETVFSDTLDEHDAAVQQLREWQAAHQ